MTFWEWALLIAFALTLWDYFRENTQSELSRIADALDRLADDERDG